LFTIPKEILISFISFFEKQGAAFVAMIAFLLFMYSVLTNALLQNERLNVDASNRLKATEENYIELNNKFNSVLLNQIERSNEVINANNAALLEFNQFNAYNKFKYNSK
jgi:hypothetical protein